MLIGVTRWGAHHIWCQTGPSEDGWNHVQTMFKPSFSTMFFASFERVSAHCFRFLTLKKGVVMICWIQPPAKTSNYVMAHIYSLHFRLGCLGSYMLHVSICSSLFTHFILCTSLQFVREVLSALAAANAFGVHHLVPRPNGWCYSGSALKQAIFFTFIWRVALYKHAFGMGWSHHSEEGSTYLVASDVIHFFRAT